MYFRTAPDGVHAQAGERPPKSEKSKFYFLNPTDRGAARRLTRGKRVEASQNKSPIKVSTNTDSTASPRELKERKKAERRTDRQRPLGRARGGCDEGKSNSTPRRRRWPRKRFTKK